MVSRILGILNPGVLDVFARKIISENARKSGSFFFLHIVSDVWFRIKATFERTVEEGDACERDLKFSVPDEYAQVVCVKWDLWDGLS